MKFVKLKYLIDWKQNGQHAPFTVEGYAFETPGWPQFHACVRRGHRFVTDLFDDWIVDHYETGMAISLPGLRNRADAPAALAKRLDEIGVEKVTAALRKYGL